MRKAIFIKGFTGTTGVIAFALLYIVASSLSNDTLSIGQAKIMITVLLPYMVIAQVVYKAVNKKVQRYCNTYGPQN